MKCLSVLFTVFYSVSCFSQNTDQIYGSGADWLSYKSDVSVSNDMYFCEYFYNRKNRLTEKKVYTKDLILVVDARLIKYERGELNFDINPDSINEKEESYYYSYMFYTKVKTYYSNKQLRSDQISKPKMTLCTCYSKDGEVLYINKIYPKEKDTVSGIFVLDSYYDWIKYGFYENGKKVLSFIVPVEDFFNNAINSTIDPDLKSNCLESFCILECDNTLDESKKIIIENVIKRAIENRLITSLDACYYQW